MASVDAGEVRLTKVNHDTEIGKGLKSLIHQLYILLSPGRGDWKVKSIVFKGPHWLPVSAA